MLRINSAGAAAVSRAAGREPDVAEADSVAIPRTLKRADTIGTRVRNG